MNIAPYFKPVAFSEFFPNEYPKDNSKRIGDVINKYVDVFPDVENADIAIIGIEDDRCAVGNELCGKASDSIRKYLYQLFPGAYKLKIADLGNIINGHTVEDTYFAVAQVTEKLLESNTIALVIGGGQDITYAIYKAYQNKNQIHNIVAVDNMFDLGEESTTLDSKSFLSHIILQKPNVLFNYTNIGYQSYFVNQHAIDLMKNLYFDTYRLGILQQDITLVEPIVRNADFLSFDISAIRQSDAPGNANATPNGFYGEDACQIARYAGLSNKITSFGIFEINPSLDNRGQTAHLAAQMIWYFIDGFYNRENGSPAEMPENYIKYNVQVSDVEEGIIFYKSKFSDRWWMELKCTDKVKEKYKRHYIIPCSENDYKTACENEIPDRWWQGYQKLM